MRQLDPGVQPTPFHVRFAEHNFSNAWVERGAFTVPRHFGSVHREALSARCSALMLDITPNARLRAHGPDAERLLSSACGQNFKTLATGEARSIHWRSDGGGVRGRGVVGRFGAANFVLGSFDQDLAWFESATGRFDAKIRDETMERGVLLLVGPFAAAILVAAGLEEASHLRLSHHGVYVWRGITVMVSRWGGLTGYQVSCTVDDAYLVFDRLLAAGRPFDLALGGQEALELLYLEMGIALSGLDFQPARARHAAEPSASSLGLEENADASTVLMGTEWAGTTLAPFTPLYRRGRKVGVTLRAAYSPGLRRVIALASIARDHAAPGTELDLGSPESEYGHVARARVVALPFLPSAQTANKI